MQPHVMQAVDSELVGMFALKTSLPRKIRRDMLDVIELWYAGDHVEPSDMRKIRTTAKHFPFSGKAFITYEGDPVVWNGPGAGWTTVKPNRKSDVWEGRVAGADLAKAASYLKGKIDDLDPLDTKFTRDAINAAIRSGFIASTEAATKVFEASAKAAKASKKPAKKSAAKKSAKKSTKKVLAGKSVLFTGKLTCCTRAEAEDRVVKAGGKNASGVSSKLSYLVIGDEGSANYRGKGAKLRKVRALNKAGANIEVIPEKKFFKMLGA